MVKPNTRQTLKDPVPRPAGHGVSETAPMAGQDTWLRYIRLAFLLASPVTGCRSLGPQVHVSNRQPIEVWALALTHCRVGPGGLQPQDVT